MLRTLVVCVSCAPLLVIGTARAQGFTGTYTLQGTAGNTVTLALQQDAQGKVTGTLSGNGNTLQIQAQVNGAALVGLAAAGGGAAYLQARLEASDLHVILVELGPGNQPRYETARDLMFTRQAGAGTAASAAPPAPVGTGPGASAPGAGSPVAGASPQDARIAQLLLSSKWCHFSYSGVAGSSSGSSYTETVLFSPDGLMAVQTGGESYYSADVRSSTGDVIAQGSTAGQRGNSQRYRWQVNQGLLMTSLDGATWQPIPLQITQNSNGYPIITAEGKEYTQCR